MCVGSVSRWPEDSVYKLKAESTGFAERLDMETEGKKKKKRLKMNLTFGKYRCNPGC